MLLLLEACISTIEFSSRSNSRIRSDDISVISVPIIDRSVLIDLIATLVKESIFFRVSDELTVNSCSCCSKKSSLHLDGWSKEQWLLRNEHRSNDIVQLASKWINWPFTFHCWITRWYETWTGCFFLSSLLPSCHSCLFLSHFLDDCLFPRTRPLVHEKNNKLRSIEKR